MKTDKRQTFFMIGIALLVIAGIMIYASLSQPKIYVEETQIVSNSHADSLSSNAGSSNNSASTTINVNVNVSVSFPINLNEASVEDLMVVDGIGEKRAVAIIEYRSTIGGYTSVEQIKEISGIGDSVYESVSPYLTV